MKVGVGFWQSRLARQSGRQVALQAMAQAGLNRVDLVLAFCSGELDHRQFALGIRDIVGHDVLIVGGSAIGVITLQQLSYQDCPAAAALFEFDGQRCALAVAEELFKDPYAAGTRLTQALPMPADARLLLLFYDSVKHAATGGQPAVLNPSAPLLLGVQHGLRQSVPIAGAGLLGDHQFNLTSQFCGTEVSQQTALALLWSGAMQPYLTTMHGCVPLNEHNYTITSIYGQFLYQLDGEPVVDILDRLHGQQHWRQQAPLKRLCLGRSGAPEGSAFAEQHYINRLISGVLPDNAGVVLFEPDFSIGDKVQFMLRDQSLIRTSARENTARLLAQIAAEGRSPCFALYLDCGGRVAAFDGGGPEEAAEIQQLLAAQQIPLLGCYCGVEIGPVLGISKGLDWSAVLVILTTEQ